MHELSLANEIIKICDSYAEARKIKTLTLLIGELSGVSPESLLFYISNQSEKSCLENADIKYKISKASFFCHSCSNSFISDEWICPECGAMVEDYNSGRELQIESLELADD